jgi:heme-degrading monooxygenase HmoA
MYVVMTRVPVKAGHLNDVLALFQQTNPALVADQDDWIEARFTANHEDGSVTVLAFWRDADSYRAFSSSEPFREVMSRFAPYFDGPPQVTVNEVLFQM